MPDHELDVRVLRKPDKHPAIFAAYDALAVNDSVVLVNNHDPLHLRDEFATEKGVGGYGWDYVDAGPDVWRIRITKLAAAPLPRILGDTTTAAGADATGAVWKLQMRDRDLDSNIIQLPPGTAIDAHTGPDIDVLLIVLSGAGHLGTEMGSLELSAGALVWLPRRSRRQFTAGEAGLRYLTVHQRRQSLLLAPTAPGTHAG